MKNINLKSILTFLILLTILVIPGTILALVFRKAVFWPYIIAIFYMPTPAIAAIITHRFIYKRSIKDLGFLKINIKQILFFPILVSLLIFLSMLISSYITGNILNIQGFGHITTDILIIVKNIVGDASIPTNANLPPFFILLPAIFVSSITAGYTINMVFALGEELGWRGFLLNEMKPLGFFRANFLIGLIWGLWHAPIILMGFNYPSNPLLGVIAMNCITIPLAYIFSIARIKTNNTIAPAIIHGIFNGYAGILVAILVDLNPFIGSILGLLGLTVLSIIVLILYITNKKEITLWFDDKSEKP